MSFCYQLSIQLHTRLTLKVDSVWRTVDPNMRPYFFTTAMHCQIQKPGGGGGT